MFSKNPQLPNFMKICPVEADLYHADRRTDMTNLLAAFHGFAKAPNKLKLFLMIRLRGIGLDSCGVR